ncbi:MAG: NAD(P)/FAD-dependent oxidoreductase [Candidatus Altiarchaeota archaeon]|nr:NAD(P)/FAD-dependent oxidoreductase [Candidatus Altiarchaeota archaeon]
MKYDAVVVGAGVSGLLSALVLSKEGKNVLVLEKEDYVGGNLRTYTVDGYTVDTGVHAITHVDNGPLTKLMAEYFDVIPKFTPYGNYFVRTKEKMVPFPWTALDWVNFDILPQKDRIAITSLLGSSVAFSIFNNVDTNQSIYDFLKNQDFSDRTWKFIDTLSYFMSGKSMRETPMWRLLKGARYREEVESDFIGDKIMGQIASFGKLIAYDGSYHQAYPRAGAGAITDSILLSMPKNKVEIRTGETVTEIGGVDKVDSVSTKKDSYDTELVVYSGFMSSLPSLSKNLPKDFTHQLSTLEQTTSLTLWLGLEAKLKEFDYLGSEICFGFDEGKHYWAMPTSNYNSSFAPKGKQLIGLTSILEGDPKKEEKRVLETLYGIIPSVEGRVGFKHVQTTVPEKAAITVGSQFPGSKSPIDGLYLVGTDTDVRSMGVTRASFSIISLLDALKKDGRL